MLLARTSPASPQQLAQDPFPPAAVAAAAPAKKAAPKKAAPKAEPKAEAAAPAAAAEAAKPANLLDAPKGEADDLTRISGVGPKLLEKLNDNGVYHFWQIQEWGPSEIAVHG